MPLLSSSLSARANKGIQRTRIQLARYNQCYVRAAHAELYAAANCFAKRIILGDC